MKRIFLLCAFVFGSAHAATVTVSPPIGVSAASTGYATSPSFVGQFVGAAFNGGFTANVGGKAVTMPASMRFAANAADFAVGAVRASPQGLLTTAVLAWLLTQGLQWIDGQWKKTTPGQVPSEYGGGFNYQCTGAPIGPITEAAAAQCAAYAGWGTVNSIQIAPQYPNQPLGSYVATAIAPAHSPDRRTVAVFTNKNTCPAGTTSNGTQCVGQATTAPATDADFAPLKTAPLPDAVAGDLATRGVPIPLIDPAFLPPYQDVPLSDPYVDPVTGQRFQDRARVTPSPHGDSAEVQPYKQPVDEAGQPEVDPNTGQEKPPEKQEDFCKINPEALACAKLGDPEEANLETQTKNMTLTPDAGWGASGASCPADLTYTLRQGKQVKFSWQPLCQMANTFRPLVIGMAWLSAILICMGISRRV